MEYLYFMYTAQYFSVNIEICGFQEDLWLLHFMFRTHLLSHIFVKLVVVAFSSPARILGECSTIHSLPVLLFF